MVKKGAELEDLTKYDPEPFFSLLDLFFERNKQVLVKHHIDSFNQFVLEIIPSILQNGDNVISEKISENKVIRYRLTFDDLGIKPPILDMDNDEVPMFPLDAIQKNLSYSSKYTATVTQWQDIIDISTGVTETQIIGTPEKDVPIAKIPIMVGSNYCNLILEPDLARKHCKYDAGGYFIVNGNEKAVLSIESIIYRKPMVFTRREQNIITYYVSVQSRPAVQFVGNVQGFVIKIKRDNSIILSISQFKEISIFILMRALGMESDEDIVDSIVDSKKEKAMMNQLSIFLNAQNSPTMTREDAIEILTNNIRSAKDYSKSNPEIAAQQKRAHLMKILTQLILPHVSSGTNNPDIDMIYKAYYIGYMIHKLLRCYLKDSKDVEEYRGCDDRDSMVNKRIELSGVLLGTLFDQCFKKMLNDCNKIFKSKNVDDKKPPKIVQHIKSNSIEQGLRQALSTGAFGSQSKKGLSQMLNRMNHLYSTSSLRRVITPTVDAATNKMTSPRHLHNTQYGSMCPLETPEGPKTGIVKNMAMLEGITISMNDQIPKIQKYLLDNIITLESVNKKKLHNYVKVFINGNWIGVATDIIKIHNDLRNMRFRGEIEKAVSLVFDYRQKEFSIYTDGGRLIRPYLTVTDNKLNFKPEMLDHVKTWDEFIARYPNVIEYIDKEEEQNIMLAVFPQYVEQSYHIMKKKPIRNVEELDRINRANRYDGYVFDRYTHAEIHPCMILGLISSNIPFPDHNQSPRGIFQYNQARQAMGLYASDYRERTDISYILYHPQVPIVTSRASKYTGTHVFPSGENAIVAIASYTGYNQEDSLLINNSAIEKGLFRAQALKKYFETIRKNPASSQTGIFMKPDRNKVDNMKDANYDKLTEEGYAKVETVIKDGDVIIGMVNPKPTTKDQEKPYKDNSTIYKSLIPGAIDKVITGTNSDGYPIIKMRVRSERIPQIGDKFSCYDKDTEILTDRGWIFFKNLTVKDKVATLIDGKVLVYENPETIQKYSINDNMYHIKTNDIDLCVTGNHNMWVSHDSKIYQLERADLCIGKMRVYQRNVEIYKGKQPKQHLFIIPAYGSSLPMRMDMQLWLSFFGMWITEGTIKDETKLIFPNGTYNASSQLTDYMRQYHNKITQRCLPGWALELSRKQSKCLLDGMLLGSRNKNPEGFVEYKTRSKQLADHFQILALHAGLSANLIVRDENNESVYILRIVENHRPIVNKDQIQDQMVSYHGMIHCCTVSSGVIYVRRNGIPVFSGNSRNGQKGTTGFKPHSSDMPFTKSGLIPDIIINPNAMPKRMTIGQLIECLMSKVCAIKGVFGDATPFTGVDLHKLNDELVEAGYEEWGNETMYDGMTGQKMKTKIFIGPTYYQRLKQMVGDKVHSRARGPQQLITRQPTEGRVRDGGMRVGEMERDAICGHGMSQFLKEKMVDNSDIYTAHVCDLCGLFAHRVPEKKYYICNTCKNTTKISKVVIPYAFKLLVQELRSINILPRIRTAKSIIVPRRNN